MFKIKISLYRDNIDRGASSDSNPQPQWSWYLYLLVLVTIWKSCFIKGILRLQEKYVLGDTFALTDICRKLSHWVTHGCCLINIPKVHQRIHPWKIWKSRPQKSLQKPSCDITSMSVIMFHYSSTALLSLCLCISNSGALHRSQDVRWKIKKTRIGSWVKTSVGSLSEIMISDIVHIFFLCCWFGLFQNNKILYSELTRSDMQQSAEPFQWLLFTINQMSWYIVFSLCYFIS